MRITALRDDIIRVRVSPDSTLPEDASWAVLADARTKSVGVQPMQDSASVGFRTAALDVRVERNPLRLIIRDLSGTVLSADAGGRSTRFQVGGCTIYKDMSGPEHYFGLGDKTGTFDRREQSYTLWNTDVGPQESSRSSLQGDSVFSCYHRHAKLRGWVQLGVGPVYLLTAFLMQWSVLNSARCIQIVSTSFVLSALGVLYLLRFRPEHVAKPDAEDSSTTGDTRPPP